MGAQHVAVYVNAEADNVDRYADLGVRVVTQRTYRSAAGVVGNGWRLAQMWWRVRRLAPPGRRVVVINAMTSIYQSLVVPLAVRRAHEYVVVVHDAVDHPGSGHPVAAVGQRLEYRRADRALVLSRAVALQLQAQGFSAPVVVGALPPSSVLRESTGTRVAGRRAPGPTPVVGFFGRLEQYKGLSQFLACAREAHRIGLPWEFRIVGNGPESRWADTALGRHAQWQIGWVANADLARVLEGFDVLLLPYTEASQSGVIPLAAELGVPVVVTPVGGLVEQVSDLACGRVATSGGPRDLLEEVGAVLDLAARDSIRASAHAAIAATRARWREAVKRAVTDTPEPQ
ncbi:glycosyltransferase [Demequina sp. NBRC 110057]|uniref:glycosyltransferase n=1 Tax=Demequina sp. NBRC 110057 TaxID=1570346 RepID=UPI0013564667